MVQIKDGFTRASLLASLILGACIGEIEPDGSAGARPTGNPQKSVGGAASKAGGPGRPESKAGAGGSNTGQGGSSTGGGYTGGSSNAGNAGSPNQGGSAGGGELPVGNAACDISIKDISVNQAVEVSVVKALNPVATASRVAPLIQEKKALFR